MNNRVAWGLAAILAVVVLAGSGLLLCRGLSLDTASVRPRWTGRWSVGTEGEAGDIVPNVSTSHTVTTNLGLVAVDITWIYYFHSGTER
jgi:hypothetical protein